jgi:hypothetical protein
VCTPCLSVCLFACHLVSGTEPLVGFPLHSVCLYVSYSPNSFNQPSVLCKFCAGSVQGLCKFCASRHSGLPALLKGANKITSVFPSEVRYEDVWVRSLPKSAWDFHENQCSDRHSLLRARMTFCPSFISCTVWIKFGLADLQCRRAGHDSRRPTLGRGEMKWSTCLLGYKIRPLRRSELYLVRWTADTSYGRKWICICDFHFHFSVWVNFGVRRSALNPFRSYVGPSDIMIFLFPTLFLILNPFQSNFYATRILPSFYLFWAGKTLVSYL